MKIIAARLKYRNVGNSLEIADSDIKPKALPAIQHLPPLQY